MRTVRGLDLVSGCSFLTPRTTQYVEFWVVLLVGAHTKVFSVLISNFILIAARETTDEL